MKKAELHKAWAQNVRVASDATINEQHHSNRDISQESAARAWLAFKKLYDGGHVFINRSKDTAQAVSFYQDTFQDSPKKGIVDIFKNRNKDAIAQWACENPHNLLLVYRTGADIMKSGTTSCLNISNLHLYLDELKTGETTSFPEEKKSLEIFDRHFHSSEEAQALHMMRVAEENRSLKVVEYNHS